MLAWIIRCLLFIAAPIAALFVARDAVNFGIVEMLVAILLIVGLVLVAAVWSLRRQSIAAGPSKK
jgi:competence protein ComGC